jgi:hypothetical protein
VFVVESWWKSDSRIERVVDNFREKSVVQCYSSIGRKCLHSYGTSVVYKYINSIVRFNKDTA